MINIILITFGLIIIAPQIIYACDNSCSQCQSAQSTSPDECTVCANNPTEKVSAASDTATFGTCKTFNAGFCSGALIPVKINDNMYYCFDPAAGYNNKKACKTYLMANPQLYNTKDDLFNDCNSCQANQLLVVATTTTTDKGYCIDKTTATVQRCSDNFWLQTNTDSNRDQTLCGSSTTYLCGVCVASTAASNCAKFLYKDSFTSSSADVLAFLTEPTDQCISCKDNTFFVKLAQSTDLGGTCSPWATPGCPAKNAVFTSGSFFLCQAVTTTGQKVPCTDYNQIVSKTGYTTNDQALTECQKCDTTNEILVVSTTTDVKGYCISTTSDTSTICSVNQYLGYNDAATGRSASCSAATTTCAICKTSTTNCATFLYKSGVSGVTTTVAVFSTEPSDRCLTCKTPADNIVKIATAGDAAGSCVPWSNPACTSKYAIFLSTGTFYICTQITASGIKQPCTTYDQVNTKIKYDNNTQALDECTACAGSGAEILFMKNLGDAKGWCISLASDTSSICQSSYYLTYNDYSNRNQAVCLSSTSCAICKQSSTNCLTFLYKNATSGPLSDIRVFPISSSEPSFCLTCQGTNLFVKIASANSQAGSCVDYSLKGCGNQEALLISASNQNFKYCKIPQSPLVGTLKKLPCTEYAYTQTANSGYASEAAALDDCKVCAPTGQNLVKAYSFDAFGCCKVQLNMDCTDFTQYKKITQANDTAYVCTSSSKAEKCTSYYYYASTSASNVGFLSESDALNNCLGCLSGYSLTPANADNFWGSCVSCGTVCTTCSEGFFLKNATVGATTGTCTAFDASSNCLLANAGEAYENSTQASLKCSLCQSGFYPKKEASSNYGVCTASNLMTECLQFAQGAYSDEGSAEANCMKCKPNLYYMLKSSQSTSGYKCLVCKGNCYTCLPGPYTVDQRPDEYCLSCYPGQGNIILTSGKNYGVCQIDASCFSASGFYTQNTQDCDLCQGGYYLNLTNSSVTQGQCISCTDANCLVCDSTLNCTKCLDGTYLSSDKTCRNCITGCSACFDGTTCSLCLPGYTYNGTACIQCIENCVKCTNTTFEGCQTCSEQYYKNSTTLQCSKCQEGCQSCTGIQPQNCTKSKIGYYLNNSTDTGVNMCYNTPNNFFNYSKCSNCTNDQLSTCQCQDYYYKSTQNCEFCITGCSKCNGPYADNCTQIQDTYYKEQGTFKQCIDNCKTCTSNTYQGCSVCLKYFYKNDTLQNCAPCHKSCNECVGPKVSDCLSCYYNTMKNKPFNFQFMYVKLASETSTKGTCQLCDVSCLMCSGKATSAKNACIMCYGSQVLVIQQVSTSSGYCASSCPITYFSIKLNTLTYCQKCTLPCNSCVGEGDQKCITCLEGYTGGSASGSPCLSTKTPSSSVLTNSAFKIAIQILVLVFVCMIIIA